MIAGSRRESTLFAGTAFLSAALLFSVQPMAARALAPLLGGAPAVWNTALVFFQTVLLAGYFYSHVASRKLSPPAQRWVQIGLLAAACFVLPMGISNSLAAKISTETPVRSGLLALAVTVGLPFFVLSTQAPLLQRWLARRGRAPFFLYSASNAGSLIALLAYPVLIEPLLGLSRQWRLWSVGFVLLLPLVWFAARPHGGAESALEEAPKPSTRERFVWIILALIPSSLLQGITMYLTSDIASLPLLWVVPLAIYLLTFTIAFSDRAQGLSQRIESAVVLGGVVLAVLMALRSTHPVWMLLLAHLGFFGAASLYCHARLAEKRPAPARLTEFYLCIAIGGAAGGIFNALIAPRIFSHVIEYPLMILALMFTRPRVREGKARERAWDISIGILIFVASMLAAVVARLMKTETGNPIEAIAFGSLGVVCYFLKNRPLRFAISLGALLVGGEIFSFHNGKTLHAERNFFGALKVSADGVDFFRLYHGTTIHGVASSHPLRHCEPLSYYYRGGGFDQIWQAAAQNHPLNNIGAVGMGSGSIFTYAQANQHWTIYEIDPAIVRIAQDPRWFHFVNCANPKIEYAIGDARVRMANAPSGAYDFLVLDAFSSDSVPIHLLTREAFQIYERALAPRGIIALHVSSRSLHLEPVVVKVAAASGLAAFAPERVARPDGRATFESEWILLARASEIPTGVKTSEAWRPLRPTAAAPLWTDDFCNLWSVIQFK